MFGPQIRPFHALPNRLVLFLLRNTLMYEGTLVTLYLACSYSVAVISSMLIVSSSLLCLGNYSRSDRLKCGKNLIFTK